MIAGTETLLTINSFIPIHFIKTVEMPNWIDAMKEEKM